MSDIFEIIRKQEQDYNNSSTQISEHVSFSPKENVDKIEAYLNSKHISGDTDSLGREKPFFNIVTAAANVWFRATDIDRANIRIKATKSSAHVTALIADLKSKEWMRKSGFGVWLNDWGRTLARYGSAVSKFVERDGELIATVVPWNRLIVDAIEFYGNPVIEKHYYTPAQLRKNKLFDQKEVEALIEHSKVSRKTIGGQNQDNKNDYIEVYEVHGEFEKELLTRKESDSEVYVQQVHICSFTQTEDGEYIDHPLYAGQEKNPYHITHLIKEDGRVMAIGAVEHLFESQWMVNHNEKAIKDQLDLASKIVFQTSDPAYLGKNAGDLDNGTILYHETNQPLTQLQNNSHDVVALANSKTDWRGQASEASSTPDAIRGITPPSGTALGTVQITTAQGLSLFELMTENKGLALEEIWRTFVIPFIKKGLNNRDEIVAVLDDIGVKQIDQLYVPNEAKKRLAEQYKKELKAFLLAPVDGAAPNITQPDMQAAQQQVTADLKPQGNKRYFAPSELDDKTWKDVFKDFEWDVEVEVTNEQSDKAAMLTSLNTVLMTLAKIGDMENSRLVLSKILEETGSFSPMELIQAAQPPAQPSPQVPPQATQAPTDVTIPSTSP
jgi:hypothetical protein